MNKQKLGYILSSVVAFVLSVLIALSLLSGVLATATTKEYILYMVNASGYNEKSVSHLQTKLGDLAIPSGLPEDFFDDKINVDTLKKLTRDCIEANFAGDSFTPDTASLKAEIILSFKQYAKENELIDASAITDESLDYLASSCVQEYINISCTPVFRLLALYCGRINKYIWYAFTGILSISVIGFFSLHKISKSTEKSRYFKYFSLCAGGIMISVLPAVILSGRYVQKIGIGEEFVRAFISRFTDTALIGCLVLGIILILCGIMLVVNKRHQKNASQET